MKPVLGAFSLDRMEMSVQRVRQRLVRAAGALDDAGVAYAVVGGNAVALWVSRVDDSAVRATQDVDLLLRREQFPLAIQALAKAGFIYRHTAGIEVFLDGPGAKARDAVHVVFAGEKVRLAEPEANPDVVPSVAAHVEAAAGEPARTVRVLELEPLVRIKLTAFRDKDRTHLRDLIAVGLIDPSWPARFAPPLSERLQMLLDTPDG